MAVDTFFLKKTTRVCRGAEREKFLWLLKGYRRLSDTALPENNLSCFTYTADLIKRHMEIFLQLPKGKMPSPCPWSAPTRRAFRRMAAWGQKLP